MSADDHRALLRDSIRSFLSREGGIARARALRGTAPGFDRDHWTGLADLGCIGALIPVARGGVGLGLGDMVAMLQELGAALGPEPVAEVAVGAAGLLALEPDAEMSARLLPEIAAGRIVPAPAWQEPGDEFPGRGIATRLALRKAKARISGRKQFVVPGHCDGFVVTADSSRGPSLCWVPRDAAGVRLRHQPRVDGTWCAEVSFDDVAVAPEDWICSPAFGAEGIEQVAGACHLAAAAQLLGVMEAALKATLEYLRVREQFGKQIGAFQALQHRAVDLYVKQELARAALDAAVETFSTAAGATEQAIAASRAKARAAESALAIGRESVQMHGAMGFADECDVGMRLKRSLVLSAWLGNATVHRGRIQALYVPGSEADAVSGAVLPTTDAPLDWDGLPDDEFRLRVRAIFEREYPPELRNPPRRLRWHECRDFYRKLGALGLLALAWPKGHGGAELSPRKQLIFMHEQDRRGVARAPDMGITMVGPGIIRHGTPEQQRKYLPAILAFEHMWCQGFSEPNAGSDLASLRTRAVRDGDDWVIDGAKTWTTFAQDATHMFMLARTAKDVKKQAGISLFLIDLATPGISIRTIRDIAGHEEFCEVHFDGVRVPADALLGGENEGWTLAKMLLANERIYLGNPRQAQYALRRVDSLAGRLGLVSDPVFAARLARLRLDVWDLASLYEGFADQVRRGEPLGPEVSILKLVGSETTQRLSELAVECIGGAGALEGEIPIGGEEEDVMSLFMNARPTTIYGGSNEVQRNVLAKHVLGLPGA